MAPSPTISFIILSYNYRGYVVEALRSALAQSFQDFEIIVVDDCSTDDSVEVVGSFTDRRIQLLRNEKNMGGAFSYNRAVGAARGEFLVNLDADDWIAPLKCEKQLEAFRKDPRLDIVGTYIQAIDRNSLPYAQTAQLEGHCNRPLDLNVVDSWVVQNPLCRSSTMMRRSSHMRIGLDDQTMTYACDFELWTRALREGCRFALLPEKLCNYRWHGRNITDKDPHSQYLEIMYVLARNVMPMIETRALYTSMGRIVSWCADHEQFARLAPRARYRAVASLFRHAPVTDFAGYRKAILSEPDPEREILGRRAFSLFCGQNRATDLAYAPDTKRLESVIDHYRKSSERWKARCEELEAATARHGNVPPLPHRTSAKVRFGIFGRSRQARTLSAGERAP
jgi:glycosyltransferase involved in cell wall biosynthesis